MSTIIILALIFMLTFLLLFLRRKDNNCIVSLSSPFRLLHCALLSVTNHDSVALGSNPGLGSQRLLHPAVHPSLTGSDWVPVESWRMYRVGTIHFVIYLCSFIFPGFIVTMINFYLLEEWGQWLIASLNSLYLAVIYLHLPLLNLPWDIPLHFHNSWY